MENYREDLLSTLRFQENLLNLTQGLEKGVEVEPESPSPVSEFVRIACKASLRA